MCTCITKHSGPAHITANTSPPCGNQRSYITEPSQWVEDEWICQDDCLVGSLLLRASYIFQLFIIRPIDFTLLTIFNYIAIYKGKIIWTATAVCELNNERAVLMFTFTFRLAALIRRVRGLNKLVRPLFSVSDTSNRAFELRCVVTFLID